jgi:predicted PurR-regulated permease PerM
MANITPLRDPSLPPTRADRLARVQFFAAGVLGVGVLYWTRDIMVPCALAALIAFILAPLVTRFRNWGIPRPVAVTLVTIASSALVLILIGLFLAQVLDLLSNLTSYKENLITKVESLRSSTSGPLVEVSKTFDDIQAHIATTQSADSVTPIEPIPTRLVETRPPLFATIAEIFNRFLGPLALAGTVFVLVFFFLLESEIAEVRLRYLVRRLRLGITDEIIDDTTTRLGMYLRMQLLVNFGYGAMVTLAMWLFDVPNYALWGMAAALLRYVPYLGPLLAAALPIALSVAIFPGWAKPMWITLCFVIAETITNGILEPMLYGRGTGVSSLGVVISAFFWFWLWGPIGIVLAMPMTICLVVVGKEIPLIAPLAYLFSGDSKSRHRRQDEGAASTEPTLFDSPPPAPEETPAPKILPQS